MTDQLDPLRYMDNAPPDKRIVKEPRQSGSDQRLVRQEAVDCEGCWTWGIPESDLESHGTEGEEQLCCPLCNQPYLVDHCGQPSPLWGGNGGKQYQPNAIAVAPPT